MHLLCSRDMSMRASIGLQVRTEPTQIRLPRTSGYNASLGPTTRNINHSSNIRRFSDLLQHLPATHQRCRICQLGLTRHSILTSISNGSVFHFQLPTRTMPLFGHLGSRDLRLEV